MEQAEKRNWWPWVFAGLLVVLLGCGLMTLVLGGTAGWLAWSQIGEEDRVRSEVTSAESTAPAPATHQASSHGPIEPCQLPGAAFTNVGLGIPRRAGFTKATGTIKAPILFADFSDAEAGQTPQEAFSLVSPGAPEFFNQSSYGRMTLELRPHMKWLRLGQPSTHYATLIKSSDGHRAFIQEAVDLADAEFDFSNADLVVVLANPQATEIPYGPAFGAAPGDPMIIADGASIPSGVTSGRDLPGWGYLWLNHEMGHNLTLPDLYAYGEDGGQGDLLRFSGTFGLMGDIGGRAPEFFAFERWMLGWLDDGQIHCQPSGETTTTLSAIAASGGSTKAVMVPTSATSALVVESRRALAYDQNLVKEGALVYIVDTAKESGHGPIEVIPALESDPFRDQSPLAQGESISHCGITVTNLDQGTEGDNVQVSVPEHIECP